MGRDRPQPEPVLPSWTEGAPQPDPGETFEEYCRRFGIGEGEIDRLLEGLDERTAVVANVRLASYLTRHLPDQWQEAMRRNELKRIKRTKGGTR